MTTTSLRNKINKLEIRTAARFYSQKVRIQKVVSRFWTNDSEIHFQEMKCGFCCKKTGEKKKESQKKVLRKKVDRLFLSFHLRSRIRRTGRRILSCKRLNLTKDIGRFL